MDLKSKLKTIKKYMNDQQIHDDNKRNTKRKRIIDYIYTLEQLEIINDKGRNLNDKPHKQEKIEAVVNNTSLFSDLEVQSLLSDIEIVDTISNDYKRGVLTIQEANNQTLELKSQFFNKTKERTIY